MERFNNQIEIFHDVLQALKAIEIRVKEAVEKYGGVQCGNKDLKKYKKILDTCTSQIKGIEMIGFSNIPQYHEVRNMLIAATLAMERGHTKNKSSACFHD